MRIPSLRVQVTMELLDRQIQVITLEILCHQVQVWTLDHQIRVEIQDQRIKVEIPGPRFQMEPLDHQVRQPQAHLLQLQRLQVHRPQAEFNLMIIILQE